MSDPRRESVPVTFYGSWQNLGFIVQEAVDTEDVDAPFIAGHEVGHSLFDVGNVHTNSAGEPFNLFNAILSLRETYDATKRLAETQNIRARTVSGPATVPPLLKKR